MYPPAQSINLDIDALSGICGSISIACWIVVFSPQIIENFRRSSAEGLSVVFIITWLIGDIFNILGAVLQGVLPTMIILAVYYTLADLVLLGQCFYYKGFTLSDDISAPASNGRANETAPLLRNGDERPESSATQNLLTDSGRRLSGSSFRERLMSLDGTHFSPTTPLHPDAGAQDPPKEPVAQTTPQRIFFNGVIVLLVCLSGVLGWWLSNRTTTSRREGGPDLPDKPEVISFNTLGQVFGYVCAVLYLGSRVPQLLLNYRRKSTEGISMLFFLFACVGNLTYVLSIFAYSPQAACEEPRACKPGEAARMYGKYIAVNLSWILGSFGTLLMDAGVFVQYFLYQVDDESDIDAFEEALVVDASEAEVRRERRRRRSVTFVD
ncbi:uncharacterized protein PV09_02090 [Verruconis gallopava]|uniref:PQ-loop-domain-containing protein n=1 Tax=Verruconis gallopava TaxID=253628 RepID=A0A0D2AK58_9PEZI|nr:uncharacterized protein PV09_02090 [Verruconis gallopava]KIW07233.1 hypothetical protein PV09_02090 [Verruconis gallopava]